MLLSVLFTHRALELDHTARPLGADFPSIKIRERLKCRTCSSRKVTITFLAPHQKGGNLQHLFEKPVK
jgi:hypothetical protein